MKLPVVSILLTTFVATAPAHAKSHLWRFTEFYSNASGTVQFIEMWNIGHVPSETGTATVPIDTDANRFIFPTDLVGDTTDKYMLLATAGFASLPGAVAPDFILPDNFFATDGDHLRYNTIIHVVNLPFVPVDGINSIDPELGVALNSPTNFAGEMGQIDLSPAVPAAPGWLLPVAGLVLVASSARFWQSRRSRSAARNSS